MKKLTKTKARAAVGGLSKPGKMPGSAWSIPAKECRTGGALAKLDGSACSICYALKNRYVFRATIAAQYRRLEAAARPDWVENMVIAIGDEPWFRWFDAGDLQSVEMLADIAAIADHTPGTMHWLPTREIGIVKTFIRTHQPRPFPPNLRIRLSAAMIDASPPNFPHTSTIHRDAPPIGHRCPAPDQGGTCADCRACWERGVRNVSYAAH